MRRALVLTGLSLLLGCNRVQGSCDQRATAKKCVEITASTIKDNAAYKCTKSDNALERGTWTEKKACDRTGAVGACETGLDRTWYYPGGAASTPEQIASVCFAARVLGPDGKELKNLTPAPLSSAPIADPTLDALITGAGPNLQANVAALQKIRAPGPITGAVKAPRPLAAATTASVYDEDLMNFGERTTEYRKLYPLKDGDDLQACGILVRSKDRQGRSDPDVTRILHWCAGLTAIAVVRTTKVDFPTGQTNVDFKSGRVDGTVSVYELPSGRALGGYNFHGENSPKVRSDQLDADFLANFGKALTAGLAKADPGATYAFTVLPSRK